MELNSPHSEHEHASISLKVLLLLFGIVLVVALGYLVWDQSQTSNTETTNYLQPKTTASNEVTTPSTTPATSADETADWKTYTNTAAGFSFKYPPTYTLSEATDTVSVRKAASTSETSYPDFAVTTAKTTLTLDQLIAAKKDSTSIKSEVKTTLGSKDAFEAIDLGIINAYTILSVNNGYSYALLLPAGNLDTLTELKSKLTSDQLLMINSFAFTN